MDIKLFSNEQHINECLKYQNDGLKGIGPTQSDNIDHVLLTDQHIQQRVIKLAKQINNDYKDKKPLFIGLLKGAFIFFADLLRHITVPYQCDFMALKSYSGTSSTGNIQCLKDCDIDPDGKDIIIVEDLIDTGRTLNWMKEHLSRKNCKSVKICVLLDKKERRTADVHIDYAGQIIPDEFVIGYGMDYDDDYRCLPFIGVLKESVYS